MTDTVRHLVAAVATQKKGRQLQHLAQQTLDAIDDGERVAAQQVSDAELVDIAELLLTAVAARDVAQIEAIGVGITAAPGVPARLLAAVGGFALAFAEVAAVDWRAELTMQRARAVVDDALGS